MAEVCPVASTATDLGKRNNKIQEENHLSSKTLGATPEAHAGTVRRGGKEKTGTRQLVR